MTQQSSVNPIGLTREDMLSCLLTWQEVAIERTKQAIKEIEQSGTIDKEIECPVCESMRLHLGILPTYNPREACHCSSKENESITCPAHEACVEYVSIVNHYTMQPDEKVAWLKEHLTNLEHGKFDET